MNRLLIPSIALGVLLSTSVASLGSAQVVTEPPRTDTARTRLDAVVVRGTTAPATVGGASAVVVALDSLRIPPSAMFDQAVGRLPFIHMRENSRGEAEISMRGSESRQVAIFLDGVPITLAWDHRADISVVPLTGIERLLLVRGVSSLLYGPNTLGGIIDVGIADGGAMVPASSSLRIRSSVDEFGAHGVSVAGAVPTKVAGGDLLLRGGGGYRSRDGFVLGRNITDPGASANDSWLGSARELRTNSDLTHYDAFATMRYRRPTGAWLGLTATGFRAERGVTPELHNDAPRFWRYPSVSRGVVVASGGTSPLMTPLGAGTVRASLGYDRGSFDIDQYSTIQYTDVTGSEDGDDRTLTGRVLATHSMMERGELRFSLTGATVTHDELLNGTDAATYRQRLWSAGTEADIGVGTTGQITAGIAYDAASTPETGGRPPFDDLSQWGARLGGSITTGDAVRLHASASRRARFPALRELYSSALNQFEPNPDLKPETMNALEAGVTTRLPGVDLQAVVFHHRLEDAVVRVRLSNPTRFKRINRDELRTTGIELLAGWATAGVSIDADLTLQDVTVFDRTANNAERRPEHLPDAQGGLRAQLPLFLELRAVAFGRYTGRQFCVDPNVSGQVDRIEDSVRGDLGIERSWSLIRGATRALLRTIRVSATLDNIANARIYSQCGLPEPGRTLHFGLELG